MSERLAEELLDAELRFDFDLRVAEKIRGGMSEAEALSRESPWLPIVGVTRDVRDQKL
jgi:hypothetical protein